LSERLLLALDTSGERYISALIEGGRIACCSAGLGSDRAWRLSAEVNKLLKDWGRGARDLSGIACGVGPGTFIGTRSGISFANGLGQALGLSIYGFPSLDALAAPHIGEGVRVVALKRARKPSFFCAVYPPQALQEGAALGKTFGEEIVTWERLSAEILPRVEGEYRAVLSGGLAPEGAGIPVTYAHVEPEGLLFAALAAAEGKGLPMVAAKYLSPPV